MREGYAVIITRHGEPILTIDDGSVFGVSVFSPDDEEAIRNAGKHLLNFIGDGEPTPCFLCGSVEECASDCPLRDGEFNNVQEIADER